MFDLTGKVAVVTGSTKGLGMGMAVALAKAGADIVSVGRGDHSQVESLVKQAGRRSLPLTIDLSEKQVVQKIVDDTVAAFGKMDILVNNAGLIRRMDAIDFNENDWDDVINLNLKNTFFLCQAAARQFIKQGTGGKIVNIASLLSYQGGIKVASYTASKSGVMGLTRLLANEWAMHNINVNAIAPGYMATELTAALQQDQGRNTEILARIPAGRWGKPEDLGGPVVFLASNAADYVNGFTIAVDGGWLAR